MLNVSFKMSWRHNAWSQDMCVLKMMAASLAQGVVLFCQVIA